MSEIIQNISDIFQIISEVIFLSAGEFFLSAGGVLKCVSRARCCRGNIFSFKDCSIFNCGWRWLFFRLYATIFDIS